MGLPQETYETFLKGLEQSIGLNINDQLMIYLCCILENTQLREDKEKYAIQTKMCAVGLNRRKKKYERFGEDEIVIGTSTMSLKEWEELYEISFMFMSLYNLRVAYFVMLFLHIHFQIKFTDFVKFILNVSDSRFPVFCKCIQHLRKNRQLILDEISSVSAPEGSDGVVFTPHEAMTFIFLTHSLSTYVELKEIVRLFCLANKLDLPETLLDDIIMYQQLRIPSFDRQEYSHTFNSNIPTYFDKVTHGDEAPPLVMREVTALFKNEPHSYDNETEFNRRRVSCGYSINLSTIVGIDEDKNATPLLSRNANLAGKFGSK